MTLVMLCLDFWGRPQGFRQRNFVRGAKLYQGSGPAYTGSAIVDVLTGSYYEDDSRDEIYVSIGVMAYNLGVES